MFPVAGLLSHIVAAVALQAELCEHRLLFFAHAHALQPAAFVVEAALSTRYVVAVVCISELLFFSAVIPCILSTKIPVTIPQILVLWVERVILSILLAGAVALIFL